jgi:hypothetical protein
MAKQPEERAQELLKEMGALIETCERQIQDGAAFRAEHGLSDADLKRRLDALPEDKKAELQAAIEQDMRDVEDDVARAKLASDHASPSGGVKRRKMRPMV